MFTNKKSTPTAMKSARRLDRRNANKNIDYAAAGALDTAYSFSPSTSFTASDDIYDDNQIHLRATRSLDLSPTYMNQTSFRISGSGAGELDELCKTLGLSGPEEFAISQELWDASRSKRKAEASVPRSRLSVSNGLELEIRAESSSNSSNGLDGNNNGIKGARPPSLVTPEVKQEDEMVKSAPSKIRSNDPSPSSVLALPPAMSLPKESDIQSLWELVRSFASGEEAKLRPFEKDVVNKGKEAVLDSCRGRVKRSIGEWIKGKQIGSGSFGTVYEAMNVTGDFFAVKEVSLLDQGGNAQQCISQLEQEIALLSQFEHENIVQYYGTDKKDAKLFIFIEYVTQGSLVSLYQKYRLQDSQVSAYTKQILKGLNYLHERDIVHRDIKCANILINADGTVKVADFGLAKQMSNLNGLKSCKGSVYWMAPEVVKPTKPYGPAADIWSLGCTVIEMLTQRLPFPDTEWIQVIFRVGKGEGPPIPNDLSEDARDFIVQCVQSNPEKRPTASQLLEHPFVNRPLSFHSSPSR